MVWVTFTNFFSSLGIFKLCIFTYAVHIFNYSFVDVYFTYHKVHPSKKVYSSVVFSVLIKSYIIYHHHLIPEHHQPKKLHQQSLPTLPGHQPLEITSLLSVSINCPILDISHESNHMCGLSCLLFTQYNIMSSRTIHIGACVRTSPPFLRLNNIPSYGQTISCLSIWHLTDIWIVCTFCFL